MNTKEMVFAPAERLLHLVSSLIELGSALDLIAGWVHKAGRDAKYIPASWFGNLWMSWTWGRWVSECGSPALAMLGIPA